MKIPISIREYTKQDKKQLVQLFDEFAQHFVDIDPIKRCLNNEGTAEYFYHHMIEETFKHEGKIYIAEKNTNILGFIAGIIKNIPDDKESQFTCIPSRAGRVIELFVTHKARGLGIGHLLMENIESYFKKEKCDVIQIEVFGPNVDAQKFYESHGYGVRNLDLIKKL